MMPPELAHDELSLNQGVPRDIARAMETYQPIPGLL